MVFCRLPREAAAKELPKVRIRHWGEYVDVMPENQAARQANRCMDCGTLYHVSAVCRPFQQAATTKINNLVPYQKIYP
ncbi:MAG: hypothetical protein HPY30_09180 [Gammaproteobacteria bacterium (ex Lamellibrachia satsuma)]|nr:MAG: hypothetical protein HPY30_09180 [Gammaproteobacteria bacterium (ex Lamellibrachia satsuma)]